jgi:hypothetical protein
VKVIRLSFSPDDDSDLMWLNEAVLEHRQSLIPSSEIWLTVNDIIERGKYARLSFSMLTCFCIGRVLAIEQRWRWCCGNQREFIANWMRVNVAIVIVRTEQFGDCDEMLSVLSLPFMLCSRERQSSNQKSDRSDDKSLEI